MTTSENSDADLINPSNIISFLRAPLAFLFFIENTALRVGILLIAMLTDCFDGYIARRFRYTSYIGTILDPAMDKLFVYCVLGVLFKENLIPGWALMTLLSRDMVLCIFGFYLIVSRKWRTFRFRSFKWGKFATAMQFLVLIVLTIGYPLPNLIFYSFVLTAVLALQELINMSHAKALT